MWSVRLALLLQAFAHELAELALVRPFASNQEIQEIESAFSLWNAVSPCGDKALAEVDIFLVYSRRLDENPVASIAAANVQNSFRARSEPWHRCFREFHIEAANLTAAEEGLGEWAQQSLSFHFAELFGEILCIRLRSLFLHGI